MRALRDTIVALGFAWLLAAVPGALFAPAVATAAPARERTPSAAAELAQLEPADDPGADDPANQDPGDGDDGDDQDPGDLGTPVPTDQQVGKMYPVEPDSLLKAKTTPGGGALDTLKAIPPGAAAFDTLKAVTPGAAPRRPGAAPQAPQRGTILGLSPLIFFAGILVVHVFVVKAVNE